MFVSYWIINNVITKDHKRITNKTNRPITRIIPSLNFKSVPHSNDDTDSCFHKVNNTKIINVVLKIIKQKVN